MLKKSIIAIFSLMILSSLTAVRVKVVVASVNLCGQRFPLWIQPDFVLPTPVSCCS
ncbi:hypothetical protein [Serratia sp. (in: enterobacteria)]|uniref:hypothetical protein n=1 Tax=Serratia sp. (in: enterobacteria) TaxID=616 RepID=UPI003F401D8A